MASFEGEPDPDWAYLGEECDVFYSDIIWGLTEEESDQIYKGELEEMGLYRTKEELDKKWEGYDPNDQ